MRISRRKIGRGPAFGLVTSSAQNAVEYGQSMAPSPVNIWNLDAKRRKAGCERAPQIMEGPVLGVVLFGTVAHTRRVALEGVRPSAEK